MRAAEYQNTLFSYSTSRPTRRATSGSTSKKTELSLVTIILLLLSIILLPIAILPAIIILVSLIIIL